jgi:hypothetical protein
MQMGLVSRDVLLDKMKHLYIRTEMNHEGLFRDCKRRRLQNWMLTKCQNLLFSAYRKDMPIQTHGDHSEDKYEVGQIEA